PAVEVARTVVPGLLPDRLRISTVIVPDVPDASPSPSRSFVKLPVMPARKVCPVHAVADRLFVVDNAAGELTWSTFSNGGIVNFTSPGLALGSTLVETPARKSDCVVSVRHPAAGAAASEKSCDVVPPSVTTLVAALAPR